MNCMLSLCIFHLVNIAIHIPFQVANRNFSQQGRDRFKQMVGDLFSIEVEH